MKQFEEYKDINNKLKAQRLMQSGAVDRLEILESIDIYWISKGHSCYVFDKDKQIFNKYRCYVPYDLDADVIDELPFYIDVRVGAGGNIFLFDKIKDSIVHFIDDDGDGW